MNTKENFLKKHNYLNRLMEAEVSLCNQYIADAIIPKFIFNQFDEDMIETFGEEFYNFYFAYRMAFSHPYVIEYEGKSHIITDAEQFYTWFWEVNQ